MSAEAERDALRAVVEQMRALHAPVEWCRADPSTGVLDPEWPLQPFCRECSDEEYVSAIEFGDVIDQAADVVSWPCPTIALLPEATS